MCYLDEAGEHIEECVCESKLSSLKRASCPRRGKDNSDLLFAVPNSGADGETLFSLADYETCLADDICVVPDEIVDKAYGPDILEKIKARARRGRDCGDTLTKSGAVPRPLRCWSVGFGTRRAGDRGVRRTIRRSTETKA